MNREWLVVIAICLIVIAGALIGIYIRGETWGKETNSDTEATEIAETTEIVEETAETEPTETTEEVTEETTETIVETEAVEATEYVEPTVYIPETEPVVTEPSETEPATEPAPTNPPETEPPATIPETTPPETEPPTEAPTEPIPETTEAPVTEETETVDIPEETETTSPEYSAEVEMLACVIYQEAGGDAYCDTCRRRVADVVLNRVASPSFPNTINEVLTQEGQYGRFHWTGIVWPERAKYESEAHAVERAYRIAQEVLNGQHSELYGNNYVWQAGFIQGYDNVYCCGHYFGKG